jgi:hypothetical protein
LVNAASVNNFDKREHSPVAKPAKPEPKRKHKIFYLTGTDRMDRMKGFGFNLKMILSFILYILLIPVNFVFEGFIAFCFARPS